MKKQIAGIFCLLAGVLSVNLFSAPDAAAAFDPVVLSTGECEPREFNDPAEGPRKITCAATAAECEGRFKHRTGECYPCSEGWSDGRYCMTDKSECDALSASSGHDYMWFENDPVLKCKNAPVGRTEHRPPVSSTVFWEAGMGGGTPPPANSEPPSGGDLQLIGCPFGVFASGEEPCDYPLPAPVCTDNQILDPATNVCVCPTPMFMQDGECTDPFAIPDPIDLGNGFTWRPPDPLGSGYGSCSSTFPTPNSNFAVGFTFWVDVNSLEECREKAEAAGRAADEAIVSEVAPNILTRTPEEVQPATDAEAVQNAAAQLGIAQASYAPAQAAPQEENRLPEYAAPAAILGALAFSSLYPDYDLNSSFNYSGENGSLDWEAGMRGDFHHGSFSSYVSAIQSDSGFTIHSGTAYRSDSFLASYTTVEAKDYMNYAVQLSAPWQHRGWNISPNLSSEFHYDRDENHSSSESGAGLDLEYRF